MKSELRGQFGLEVSYPLEVIISQWDAALNNCQNLLPEATNVKTLGRIISSMSHMIAVSHARGDRLGTGGNRLSRQSTEAETLIDYRSRAHELRGAAATRVLEWRKQGVPDIYAGIIEPRENEDVRVWIQILPGAEDGQSKLEMSLKRLPMTEQEARAMIGENDEFQESIGRLGN